MTLKTTAITAAALFGLLSAPASALTLINDDQDTYTIHVMIGEGDATNEKFELPYDHMMEDFCNEGCTIRLSNGASKHFVGDEVVLIQNGNFVVTE